MAPAVANRFALIADNDEEHSPMQESATHPNNPFANQISDNDNPWEEVKRGGRGVEAPKMKTLVIREENKAPLAQCHPKVRMRDFSGSTQGTEKGDEPFENWCGVCQMKLPSKTALLTHIKLSQKRHDNYCNLCKRVFKDRNGLKNHVDNSLGHEIFCNLCLSAFKDAWGLKNHFENNYSVGHEFVCLTCLLGFRNKTDMDKHLHTGAKHVWCTTCHRRFRNQDERDEHWVKTTKHKHCLQPGCEFDAPNAEVLEEHLENDHFQCDGCKRIFPSQTKLNAHYGTCQFEVRCPSCGCRCAGQANLALHMESCFYCAECDYLTTHEDNYKIHMTKHASTEIPCWRCATPMRKCSTLIHHLESGKCPKLPDPPLLMLCLGKFWHSTLYMDIDIHVQIRSNRIDLEETVSWIDSGLLQPFVCRAEGCGKTFGHFSSLLLHVESQACGWDVDRLRLDLLQQEFDRMCVRKDSAVSS